ncbi:MAG: DUF2322 family protein [Vogesella sp.]|uniref:DUF2322 family protein n=1 Tax=Vogesella sp. TaxID=1904252 RepID=UPI00391C31CA
MPAFADILPTLPAIDGIAALSLHNAAGEQVALLETKPGSSGSVRVYHALWLQHGCINHAAAQQGLALYAEHTADALAFPGKHPNIDRLLALQEGDSLSVNVIPA